MKCDLPFTCQDVFDDYIGQEHESSDCTCLHHLSRFPLHMCVCLHTCACVMSLHTCACLSLLCESLSHVCMFQGVGRDG